MSSFDETKKFARTVNGVLPVVQERWSPRSFKMDPVEPDKLHRIFEAARWAASSYGEQPWRFIVGVKGQGNTWQKLYDSLAEFNQAWNQHTPVLVLICSKLKFSHNDQENFHNGYDAGQAAATLALQATAEGLHTHQMGGFSRTLMREHFNIPEGYHPYTAMSIGYRDEPDALPDKYDFRNSERAPRTRKPLSELVFTQGWDTPFFD
jgi:nitroreductase